MGFSEPAAETRPNSIVLGTESLAYDLDLHYRWMGERTGLQSLAQVLARTGRSPFEPGEPLAGRSALSTVQAFLAGDTRPPRPVGVHHGALGLAPQRRNSAH